MDAGSIAEGLPIEKQVLIEHILISHAHLDHIKDLAFLCDNCFGMRERPFEVYCNQFVCDAIHQHLFNDVIWPDFSRLPSRNRPTIRFHVIHPERSFPLGAHHITPVEVNHPGNALGLIIDGPCGHGVLFTQDTGPTERIWQVAKKRKNLRAIFTEVSFPNELARLARQSDHHTPQSLSREIPKMPEGVRILLGHLKPFYQEKLRQQIQEIDSSGRITILDSSGAIFPF